MIHEAVSLVRKEIVTYFSVNGYSLSDADDIVVIENIGLFDSSTSGVNLDDKVVLTVVNIEEESTLKNSSFIKKNPGNPARYINPPIYLNIYLLVTACNKSTDNNSYLDALNRLSTVIRFFQSKDSFSIGTSTFYDPAKFASDEILNLRVTAELYTLTFEQLNHLWGSLGGKQMPFAMYKLRLVAISDHKLVREVPLIEEIETNASPVLIKK
jgi:hypothetical protein